MRPEPKGKPPAVKPVLEVTDLVTEVRRYRLITPLFGGGVKPGVADPVTTIRGPGIRGQLRFWWRACRGGGYKGDLQKMRAAEEALWGAASSASPSGPSRVVIEVVTEDAGSEQHPYSVKPGNKNDPRTGKPKPTVKANKEVAPPYAAFPLQPTEQEARKGGIGMPTGAVRSGVCFILRITYPSAQRPGVEAALWAWETFGGVGARTRRGFGALQLLKVDDRAVVAPAADQVEKMIQDKLAQHVVDGPWPEGVPHLPREFSGSNLKIVHPDQTNKCFCDPLAAWQHLIVRLQQFRQSRNRVSDPKKPGRSLWPEPDAIRRITGQSAKKHAQALSNVDKFPRAAFGLPIIFHFKDKDAGDPEDTITLAGENVKRLASPLILRPLACAQGAVGLALVLEGTGVEKVPGGLELTQVPKERRESQPVSQMVDPALTEDEAKAIRPLENNTDVLRAFLAKL